MSVFKLDVPVSMTTTKLTSMICILLVKKASKASSVKRGVKEVVKGLRKKAVG